MKLQGGNSCTLQPKDEWLLLTNMHPGYISWEEYELNQRQLRDRGRVDMPWLHAALSVEREFSTEEVFRFQRLPRPDPEHCQTNKVSEQPQNDFDEGDHAPSCHSPARAGQVRVSSNGI